MSTLEQIQEAQSPKPAAAGASAIRAAGLELAFLSHQGSQLISHNVLGGVDLDVEPGRFVSIVGPSGCGKTTLLNVLAGLEEPTGGMVEIGGAAPRIGRPDVGYMLARPALLPWRTVEANVKLGLELQHRTENRTTAEEIAYLLARVGLESSGKSLPGKLSQGMRQRVALARTFALNTPFLLMDEPFAALDAQTKLVLEQLLLSLWEESRKTVVFITHDLYEALALSDEIIVFSRCPAEVKEHMDVPLGRPRDLEVLQTNPDFHGLYMRLWNALRE